MLKMRTVLVLALIVFCVQGNTQAHKAQHGKKGDQPTLGTTPVGPKQSNSPALQPESQTNSQPEIRIISTPAKDGWDKAAVWINAILALIGAGGIVAATLTIRKLERQTKATEDAAEAALVNSRAFINAERPWIVVELVHENAENQHLYTITGNNVGRTPARVESIWGDIITVQREDVLPAVYPYGIGGEMRLHPRLFPPSTKDRIIDVRSTHYMESHPIPDGAMIFIIGCIVYTGALNIEISKPNVEPYETRWCYPLIAPNHAVPVVGIPPAKYNDCT